MLFLPSVASSYGLSFFAVDISGSAQTATGSDQAEPAKIMDRERADSFILKDSFVFTIFSFIYVG